MVDSLAEKMAAQWAENSVAWRVACWVEWMVAQRVVQRVASSAGRWVVVMVDSMVGCSADQTAGQRVES